MPTRFPRRPPPRRRSRNAAPVLAALLAPLAGCGGADNTNGGTGDVYVDHGHDRPVHHPESFPAAVEALRDRLPTLADANAAGRAEAAEIVDWLPELAADSDLTESQWEPLAVGARELEALLPRLAASDGEAAARADAVLDRLAASVREYGEAEFEVVPHADHHDHNAGSTGGEPSDD